MLLEMVAAVGANPDQGIHLETAAPGANLDQEKGKKIDVIAGPDHEMTKINAVAVNPKRDPSLSQEEVEDVLVQVNNHPNEVLQTSHRRTTIIPDLHKTAPVALLPVPRNNVL